MTVALIATSHSPLLEHADLEAGVAAELDQAFTTARRFAEDFDPELVISFGPDHYNGFFYNLMPPFCIGYAANSVGDYGTQPGPLNVPEEIARGIAEAVMSAGIDLAVSLQMELDHGAVQPMEILFGDIAARPVVPIFLNSVAPPFTPLQRVRLLGEAVGRHVAQLEMRTLLIASGGLSHDPPVARLATATPEQRRVLLGHHLPATPSWRKEREQRVVETARAFAAGTADIQDLAPDWDRALMATLASGDLTSLDAWTPEEMARIAGNSSHEVRSWIAAYAALGSCGAYSVQYSYYRPIRELIAGFGLTTVTLD
ncbi:3-carboxyethylcatechol 2,3-dioxygenase [Micromonospora sp. NPDC005197]|uniref:3-carboxyethylcatechol 2,3-dioxygenase n=1 Tax=unclassified Micromonospora TaxID=2617518 RepID=UPI0033A2F718